MLLERLNYLRNSDNEVFGPQLNEDEFCICLHVVASPLEGGRTQHYPLLVALSVPDRTFFKWTSVRNLDV